MAKIISHPKVILVGRTNVGKSTIFNRLTKNTKTIVLNKEGVTRDYISEIVDWADKKFELIDTGGLPFKKEKISKDPILEQVQQKVINLLEKASLILFVCDAKNGLVEEDLQVAKLLHKTKKPVLLLLNKADNINAYQDNYPEFFKLGFDQIIPISAIHGTGIADLLEKITENIKQKTELIEDHKPVYKVTILGKPNVGKSSLMNILSKKERSIVTDIPGTTREAISQPIYTSCDLIQITDTAGIRKKSRVSEDLESLMVKSSLEAVRISDIILLVVDASEKQLSDQELKLLFYAYEQKKAIIIIFNKIDLLSEYDKKSFEYELQKHDFLLKKIPQIWISCKDKKNVHKIILNIEKLWQRLNQEIDKMEINEIVKTEWQKKPMFHNQMSIKLFKIRPLKAKTPTFILHVNKPEWFKETQLGFIENVLRKHFDFKGCPIQFVLKKI
ncbi:MAG: ribosome biogenesis GTPase Der [Candidatus Babeliales bacterium]